MEPAPTNALFREFSLGSVNGNTGTEPKGVVDNAGDVATMIDRNEFDLVAVGRALIVNPNWAEIIRRGAFDELVPFDNDDCSARLY